MTGHASTWSGKGLLALFGVAVALLLSEAGLRLLQPRLPALRSLLYSPTFRTEYDEVRSLPELLGRSTLGYHPFGHTPGFVLNSRGFRTDEYGLRKPRGTFRALVFGDSFTFDSSGVPIAKMWHQVFERAIAERLGRPAEVLSLSAPGVGPRFSLRLWELEGQRLDADLVVLAFFVGNDLTDEAGVPLEASSGGRLAGRSLTFRLVRNAWRALRARAPDDRAAGTTAVPGPEGADRRGGFELPDYAATYDPERAAFREDEFLRVELDRLRAFAGWERERFDPLFDQAAAVVERMARSVEGSGGRFAVMIIPDEAQVDPDLLRRLRSADPDRAFDPDRPQRRLAEFLASRGIPALDLLPAFRERGAAERLYRPRDTHWNLAGNQLAGSCLAGFVAAALGMENPPAPEAEGEVGSP